MISSNYKAKKKKQSKNGNVQIQNKLVVMEI